MKETNFTQKITLFVKELNSLLSMNCLEVFDKTCPYPCCLDQKTGSIIFNYDLMNQTNQSALNFLGEDYLKYFILHEYGHMKYNQEVKKHIESIFVEDPLLKFFIEHYNLMMIHFSQINPSCSISIDVEHFWAKQYYATCEFMADYFTVQQINKNFNYLNSCSFKLWRANSVLDQYNYCHTNNWIHIEPLRYYHIPETITNTSINFENDSINDLIKLSLNNSLKSLILVCNQLNNITEYNATNFSEKISSIIEELNKLR